MNDFYNFQQNDDNNSSSTNEILKGFESTIEHFHLDPFEHSCFTNFLNNSNSELINDLQTLANKEDFLGMFEFMKENNLITYTSDFDPKDIEIDGSCDCRKECTYNTGYGWKYADYGYSN